MGSADCEALSRRKRTPDSRFWVGRTLDFRKLLLLRSRSPFGCTTVDMNAPAAARRPLAKMPAAFAACSTQVSVEQGFAEAIPKSLLGVPRPFLSTSRHLFARASRPSADNFASRNSLTPDGFRQQNPAFADATRSVRTCFARTRFFARHPGGCLWQMYWSKVHGC